MYQEHINEESGDLRVFGFSRTSRVVSVGCNIMKYSYVCIYHSIDFKAKFTKKKFTADLAKILCAIHT